jgi:hypothetical protein
MPITAAKWLFETEPPGDQFGSWPKAETRVRPGLVGFLGWCRRGVLCLTSNIVPKYLNADRKSVV